jgi:hypothetical protein
MSRKKGGGEMHQIDGIESEVYRKDDDSIYVMAHGDIKFIHNNESIVMGFSKWFSAAKLFMNLDYSKMTILEKICYWYLFQRKINNENFE